MPPPRSMSPQNQRIKPSSGQNRWTPDQRLTLHLLHSRFTFTLSQRVNVFNAIFADSLRRCGVVGGLSKARLTAQYAERLKTSVSARATWGSICKEAVTGKERLERDEVVERIEWVARGLGIVARRSGRELSGSLQLGRRDTKSAETTRGWSGLTTAVEEDCRPLHSEKLGAEINPTAGPKRPQRATGQFSKWTMDATSHVAEADRDVDSDSDFVPKPMTDLGRFSRSSPEVVVPMTPKRRGRPRGEKTVCRTPSTPKKTPSSIVRRKEIATMEYHRPNGSIMLTPEEFEATKGPLVAPSTEEVHPPLAGLLLYWTADSVSKLDDRGEFVAGKFAKFSTSGADAPPLPTLKDFKYFWHDVGAHMNREPIQSPWISTCNNLNWIVRLAVQESQKGITSGKITLIRVNALNRASVFHAQPLHKELRKKRPFDKGAFRYQGQREFLVYHKIPKKAILHSFAVKDLIRLTVYKPAVGNLLRLHHLAKTMTAMRTLTETLSAQKISLNAQTITAIAAVVKLFGLDSESAVEQTMHIVSDIVQGWSLVVSYRPPAQWSMAGDTFASAMVTPSATTPWMKSYQKMKIAFLDGVRWSRGDINTRHSAEKMRLMLGRAKRIGLEDPAKILMDELDAGKMAIGVYDQRQRRVLQGGGNMSLLTEASEDDNDVTLPITPRSGGMRIDDDDILYDTDDDMS